MNDSLPLLHDGDAYVLTLDVGEKHVLLSSILIYPGNTNTEPSHSSFRDLPPEAKRAVITQINRRHKGKMVRV